MIKNRILSDKNTKNAFFHLCNSGIKFKRSYKRYIHIQEIYKYTRDIYIYKRYYMFNAAELDTEGEDLINATLLV